MNAVSRLFVAAAAATALSPLAAQAQDVELTYLTHWAPETVALLEQAAGDYSAAQSRTSRSRCGRCRSATS